ncbi:MAG: xanthine dehydrogenase family protein subunit M [Chloroflexi bacterium]|nr:xanthine dehydrogenase family protein subunit M [Chloroflexota bacterium]
MVATFDFLAANSVPEALDLLARHGSDAKVLAGGQSLIPLINLGLAQPSVLVDLNHVRDLAYIERRDGSLAIGALTRHSTAAQSPLVREICPLLAEAVPLIGDRQVRSRGTVGGSIAHADPVAEILSVAVCLGATMRVEGPGGSREVPSSDFFLSYLTTALGPDEILAEVRFPELPAGTGTSFQELVRRQGDFAIVAAAATITLGDDGAIRDARLALSGVAPTPIRADAAEGWLAGKQPEAAAIQEAARLASDGLEPDSDVMASSDYRRAMAEVFARRALTEAARRAHAKPTR